MMKMSNLWQELHRMCRVNYFELVCRSISKGVIGDAMRENNKEVHSMFQDAEEIEASTEQFDVVRSNVFTVYSMWLVIIAELKARIIQRTEIC